MVLLRKSRIKTVKVTEKVKIFLESVTKTVLYVTCTPLNSNVESLTLPLLIQFRLHFAEPPYPLDYFILILHDL